MTRPEEGFFPLPEPIFLGLIVPAFPGACLTDQSQQADQDKVNCNDVVQQLRPDEDHDACDEGNEGLCGHTQVHLVYPLSGFPIEGGSPPLPVRGRPACSRQERGASL